MDSLAPVKILRPHSYVAESVVSYSSSAIRSGVPGMCGTYPKKAIVSFFPPTAENSQFGLRCIFQVLILVPETWPLSHLDVEILLHVVKDFLTLSCLSIDQRDL